MLLRAMQIQAAAVLLLVGSLVQPATAQTLIVDDFYFLGAEVVQDIQVIQGGVLFMVGATVNGDVQIEEGGAIVASQCTFFGDVKSDRALLIEIGTSDVLGNVDLKRTSGPGTVFGLLPAIFIFQNDISGNVKISRSDVNSINVFSNQIAGKLDLDRNISVLPPRIEGNVVGR